MSRANQQNAAFFTYRQAQRALGAERLEAEAEKVAEDALKSEATRATTKAAFESHE